MMKCREATRLLSEREDRALSTGERLAVRMHVFMCSACSNFGRQLPFLRDAMRHYRDGPQEPRGD